MAPSTADDAELAALAEALRCALGTAGPDTAPALDPNWRAGWPKLAELGIIGLCVPTRHGGFGNEVSAALVASREGAQARARRLYRLLLAGDALGGVQRMLDRTVAYARERQAFGKPIGGFQAVQHRLVDHTIRVRGAALATTAAAARLNAATDDPDGGIAPGAERQVLLAEAVVSSGAVHVLHDLLQLTGAIGFTWEHGLHLYERRAHLDARLARNPRAALRMLADLEGWTMHEGNRR